jgi:hypothetical protein
MPRKKKHPAEWTTEEAMKKLFPKKARDKLKEEAERESKPQVKPSTRGE